MMKIDAHTVAQFQAVNPDYLTEIEYVPFDYSDRELRYAKLFFKPSRCFDNALTHSMVTGSTVVVGYVYIPLYGIAIEHAWNRREDGDFDYTRSLFWDESQGDEVYFELLSFNHDEAHQCMEDHGGIDHLALRTSGEYDHIFRYKLSR